jgi:hypothetical protein
VNPCRVKQACVSACACAAQSHLHARTDTTHPRQVRQRVHGGVEGAHFEAHELQAGGCDADAVLKKRLQVQPLLPRGRLRDALQAPRARRVLAAAVGALVELRRRRGECVRRQRAVGAMLACVRRERCARASHTSAPEAL